MVSAGTTCCVVLVWGYKILGRATVSCLVTREIVFGLSFGFGLWFLIERIVMYAV